MRLRKFILNFLFDTLYHSLAWAYDFVAAGISLNYWYRWVEETLPYLHGEIILELGCGTGHLIKILKGKKKVIGVDLSPQMIRITKHRLDIHNYTYPFLLRADGKNLPFRNETIDHVVATFPAPYIFQEETLSGIASALKRNGSLIILLSATPPLNNSFERITSWIMNKLGGFDIPDDVIIAIYQRVQKTGLTPFHLGWKSCPSGKILVLVAVKSVQTL